MPLASIHSRPILAGLAAGTLLVLAVVAFAPGLGGVFIFDSVERVARNPALRAAALDGEHLLAAAYAEQADYPRRGLAYVTFALNYYLAGQRLDPFVFKLTNLIIHMLNGVLVAVLAALVIGRWRRLEAPAREAPTAPAVVWLALLAAGLWLLHPIQVTSVLYVVQRMTSLAGTWVIAGAIAYILARQRLERGGRGALAGLYGGVIAFAAIGFMCKQNALLLPAYCAVLEIFLFERRVLGRTERRRLTVFFMVVLGLPVLAAALALVFAPERILSGYANRDFTLVERLLTQARVLFFYLGLLLAPGVRRFGLYHDDIAISTGLLEPWSTLPAVIAWAVILFLTLRGAGRREPWAFAAAWFMVGHSMESTLLPLELVHEHRNYVPALGIWIAVAAYAGRLWERVGRLRIVVAVTATVWLAALAGTTHLRTNAWRSPAVLLTTLAENHPRSYRSAVGYAFNGLPADADLGLRFGAFQRAATLNPDVITPLIEMSKLAMAVAYFLGQSGQAPAMDEAGRVDQPLESVALSTDAQSNARLLASLDEEIIRRLASGPLRTDNVVALIATVDCMIAGSRECMGLAESIGRWHEAALSNEVAPRGYRAVLGLSLAKYHASRGDQDVAVREAQIAGELSSDNLAYRLQQAVLLAWLERWDALAVLLGDIEERFPRRAPADPTYRELRAKVDDATSHPGFTGKRSGVK